MGAKAMILQRKVAATLIELENAREEQNKQKKNSIMKAALKALVSTPMPEDPREKSAQL